MKRIIINESQIKLLTEGKRKRYTVNLDVELPSAGRTASRITPKEFEGKMKEMWEKNVQDRRFTLDNFIYKFCNQWNKERPKELNALMNDISKIDYDTENIGVIGKIESVNGLTYLKCYAGGDWENPILFFMYWDGSKFRGYIPTYGNAYNRKYKRAFGNNDEEDVEFLKTQNIDTDEELTTIIGSISYDVNACMKDFKARVKVK